MRPDRLVLGIDTSAAHCAAALLCKDRILAARDEGMDRGQAERLMPLIEGLLAEVGADWADLGRIGVGTGPGNFTGLRIAVAAARGLSLSLGVPAIGVTGFDWLAEGQEGPVLACLPAPQGRLHARLVRPGDVCVSAAEVKTLRAEEGLALARDLGVPLVAPPWAGLDRAAAPLLPVAEAIARAAARRDAAAEPRPAPFYIRPADAAPAREAAPPLLD